jgi:SAM-dependent methyltransferase
MKSRRVIRIAISTAYAWLILVAIACAQAPAQQKAAQKPFEPEVGQAGKDVVWVPTSQALVDRMLDLAKVTPQDYVIDLGSGDGRTVITAAKRGARAAGIEYNPNMVELSKQKAAEAGVASRTTFEKADLFESDFSKATVITMFLLPEINLKLRPKLLDLKPGTRIVSNSFTMEEWEADETVTIDEESCSSWCTALLWIVPAKIAGAWQMVDGGSDLNLAQDFQNVSGKLGSTPIVGKIRGNDVTFTAGRATYAGVINGNTMQGTISGGAGRAWTAMRK